MVVSSKSKGHIQHTRAEQNKCGHFHLTPFRHNEEQLLVFSPGYLHIDIGTISNLELCEVGAKYKCRSISTKSHNGNRN